MFKQYSKAKKLITHINYKYKKSPKHIKPMVQSIFTYTKSNVISHIESTVRKGLVARIRRPQAEPSGQAEAAI